VAEFTGLVAIALVGLSEGGGDPAAVALGLAAGSRPRRPCCAGGCVRLCGDLTGGGFSRQGSAGPGAGGRAAHAGNRRGDARSRRL